MATRKPAAAPKSASGESPNAFIGLPHPPSPAELAAALGPTRELWDGLQTVLAREYGVTGAEWNSYSKKSGWALRLKQQDRNIVYLSPRRGSFLAAFALGDKAVQAARASKLPARVLKLIGEARRYAEGTAVRLEVRAAADAGVVERLAAIKLAN